MGRGRDESGDTDHPPLVVTLDIRPPHGPPERAWPIMSLIGAGVFFVAAAVLLSFGSVGIPLEVAAIVSAPGMLLTGVAVGWFGQLAAWRAALRPPKAFLASSLAARFERGLRANWMPIIYHGWISGASASGFRIDQDLLFMRWIPATLQELKLPRPRALVISPESDRESLPLKVRAARGGSQRIRATPGAFILRQPLRLLCTLAVDCAILGASAWIVWSTFDASFGSASFGSSEAMMLAFGTGIGVWTLVGIVVRMKERG